jgi:archaellum component FlaC
MENTDKLDEFVNLNKEQFDSFEPSAELWQKIQSKQTVKLSRHKWNRTFMKIAAAVVFLFGTYIAINKSIKNKDQFTRIQSDSATNVQIAEFSEAQTYYSSELKNKLNSLKENAKNYPEILDETYSELNALDNEYKTLQKDLQDGVENTEVVSAMIQNYKYKLEIIDKINEVINEQEAQKSSLHHDI